MARFFTWRLYSYSVSNGRFCEWIKLSRKHRVDVGSISTHFSRFWTQRTFIQLFASSKWKDTIQCHSLPVAKLAFKAGLSFLMNFLVNWTRWPYIAFATLPHFCCRTFSVSNSTFNNTRVRCTWGTRFYIGSTLTPDWIFGTFFCCLLLVQSQKMAAKMMRIRSASLPRETVPQTPSQTRVPVKLQKALALPLHKKAIPCRL